MIEMKNGKKILTTPISAEDIAVGISHLPNDCGLIFKVLGKETSPVKKVVRQFCSTVRMQVKGKPLPEEFAWR